MENNNLVPDNENVTDLNQSENTVSSTSDEFVIGSGFKLDETHNKISKKPIKKKKRNSKKIILSVFWIIFILAISLTLAVGGIYCVIDYMGLGSSEKITVTVEEGESLDDITAELHEKGAVKIPMLFKFYAGTKDYYEQFTVGAHTFNTDIGYSGIIAQLTTVEGYTTETVKVEIPLAATVDDIAELLAEKGVCSEKDFYDEVDNGTFDFDFIKDIPIKKVHYRLEGYLYPDTYEFYKWNSKDGAHFAIKKMLENFNEKFSDEYKTRAEKMGYSLHEMLTLASVVELECCGYDAEYKNVAAVFYNRLENWGEEPKMLGSSPTADYPYGGGNYDTNKIEGLPPGPLCSAGLSAIKGVLYPNEDMDKKYFYFVTDSDFKFYYTSTLQEHNDTIYRLQVNGKWNEE